MIRQEFQPAPWRVAAGDPRAVGHVRPGGDGVGCRCDAGHAEFHRRRLIDQAADPPQRALDEAMRQIVRGSNNPGSVMGPHSLLETMYGNLAISGTINASSPEPAGSCSNSRSARAARA